MGRERERERSMVMAVSTDHAQTLLQCSALIIILTHMLTRRCKPQLHTYVLCMGPLPTLGPWVR